MAEATVAEQDEATAGAAQDEDFFDPDAQAAEGEAGGQEATGNGRKTLADLAAEAPGPEASTEDEDPQPRLFGAESKVTGAVRGKRPETSKVKFKSAAIDVAGQFHSDDLLELRFVGQVDKVEFVNKRDKAGKIVSVTRVHHVSASAPPEQLSLSADLLHRRAEYVADALGVDVGELIAAQERAATEVQPAE